MTKEGKNKNKTENTDNLVSKSFFFQIALGGKFLNGVIENVRQYSLPELLTFWIVVTL